MRRAMKDKTYRTSRLGLEVAHFIRYLKNEYGATPETLRDYEAILAKLALDHAELELAAFEPPEGTALLRAFIESRWARGCASNPQEGQVGADVVFPVGQWRVQAHGQPGRGDQGSQAS